MITIWLLGFSLISFILGGGMFTAFFAAAAVFSWLCAFTYHAFIAR